ncbi:putative arthrofactin synthetase B [Burkholderia pseudomallei MSHR983]|nr:putative arthrofactin synthetase B [Burkholderia pseudomallei MSHR983]
MHSSVVRSAGGSEAGGDCADVRRAATELRGTQRPSEPACALSAGARRGPGPTGCALRGTRNRDGGGAAGDPEGGRCVCAAGSEPSARAFAPDAGRYEPGGGARRRHRRGRARIVRITCRGSFAPRAPVARHRAMAGMQPGESVHPAGARRAASRIRDLHVGLERRTEGSDERASRGGEPAVVDATDVRAGRARRGIAKDAVQLRRIGVGVLLAADVGRAAGDREAGGAQGSGVPVGVDRSRTRDDAALRTVDAAGVPGG